MLKLVLLSNNMYACYNSDNNCGVTSRSLEYVTSPINHNKGVQPWEEWLSNRKVYATIDFISIEQLELDYPELFI